MTHRLENAILSLRLALDEAPITAEQRADAFAHLRSIEHVVEGRTINVHNRVMTPGAFLHSQGQPQTCIAD